MPKRDAEGSPKRPTGGSMGPAVGVYHGVLEVVRAFDRGVWGVGRLALAAGRTWVVEQPERPQDIHAGCGECAPNDALSFGSARRVTVVVKHDCGALAVHGEPAVDAQDRSRIRVGDITVDTGCIASVHFHDEEKP